MSNDLAISWEDFHKKSHTLGLRLKEVGPWKGIISVTRGGMIPAGIVAQEVEVKNIQTLCIETYSHQEQSREPIFHHTPKIENEGEGWIVIDELSDTGNTFKTIREIFSKAHYACVYTKPDGESQVDTFVESVSQDTWIYFPWEREAQKFAKYL